jgi:adenosylhomocysteine nucleosidase
VIARQAGVVPTDAVRRVGYLAPMRSELRPLVRHLGLRVQVVDGDRWHRTRSADTEVVACLANIGTAEAAAATERLLDAFDVHHVVVVGIAGSLDPALEIGDLVVPEVVVDHATGREFVPTNLANRRPRGSLLTSDDYLHDPDDLAALIADGVVAVDMETAAVAAVCETRGVPWSVFRAVSDRASDAGLIGDAILDLVRPDGSANMAAVARFLITKPHRIPQLVRLGRGSQTAADVAARAAAAAIPS